MPKIQCGNVSDDLFERLSDDARRNERSLEGHVRFILKNYYINIFDLPEWMSNELQQSAKKGFRSVRFEVIKRLAESMENEGVTPPDDFLWSNAQNIVSSTPDD